MTDTSTRRRLLAAGFCTLTQTASRTSLPWLASLSTLTTLPALAQAPAGTPAASAAAAPAPSAPASGSVADASHWLTRAELASELGPFIDKLVAQHGFIREHVFGILAQSQRSDLALKLIQPPAPGRRSWSRYRARNVDPIRIHEGIKFWNQHDDTLRRAYNRWGVPPSVIVAILGIETVYGRNTGNVRTLDALATLGFDYPRRAPFFRDELENFLLLVRDLGVEPTSVTGSYAGALGVPQFMPGSWRRYAVDFSGDGRIDLLRDTADVIGSVANFLAEHGWQRGQPTHVTVKLDSQAQIDTLLAEGIEPRRSIRDLAQFGVTAAEPVDPELPAALIDLPDADAATTYWLGLRNFYVVTRYNRSNFYAGAVLTLSQVLDKVKANPDSLKNHQGTAAGAAAGVAAATAAAATPARPAKHGKRRARQRQTAQ